MGFTTKYHVEGRLYRDMVVTYVLASTCRFGLYMPIVTNVYIDAIHCYVLSYTTIRALQNIVEHEG